MKHETLKDIKRTARNDFKSVLDTLRSKNLSITASVNDIKFKTTEDVVTASCDFESKDSKDILEATINYGCDDEGIYADCEVDEISDSIESAITSSTTITAAEDDGIDFNDPMFDDGFGDEPPEDDLFTEEELISEEDEEDMENPETEPDIEADNNIAGHYIAECSRCHGVFISALIESDQQVEYLSGICPLCEKESDQYIKWVIKPVETTEFL